MTKKRTKSQSTGELGEAIFRQFALENRLLPNKVEYDYGLDFLCQVTGDISKNIGTVNSQFIGVNVKSSKSKRVKATLNSDDMLSALQSDFPILFALIDIKNKEVFFRFFDMDLLKDFSQLADEDKTFL